MGFSGWIRLGGAQAGVFVFGALCWAAAGAGHVATALVCAVAGLILINILLLNQRRRQSPVQRAPDATFASEQSRRRLGALVDETPSPLLLQEEDGRLIAVNRAARQMFDVSSELPVATRWALLGPGDRLDSLRGQIDWAGGRYAIHKARLDHALLAILIDITPEVRAAEASALRDLLKVLNHELMNALTPVASMSRSALELIDDNTPESLATARGALRTVVARTEGLVGFVDSYRILTRLPPPDTRPIALGPFADEVARSFRAQWDRHGVSFELRTDIAGAIAVMDAEQIRLCLTNLLNNAAEAAFDSAQPRVRLALTLAGHQVEVAIEDSGRGIETAMAETIFLPFYTTKANGTGVGLSLARQILQGHGSSLVLRPPGELGGAHFCFALPRPANAANPWEAN
ncbi:PAS domain-containing sensor histidine kinase [Asticcacaulis sp. AC402]|uniref:sensor histidine kinase n=1 Tax=Asticcacaulis sp. AC402 TaxID=1282361 RepID=UPI0003C3AE72|nr:ATP-binding protein [Asticcacaulis sp. AC402]ESQ75668.1 hypothetical protein ABAC402_09075 [Asticcacaulis sp. AC402]